MQFRITMVVIASLYISACASEKVACNKPGDETLRKAIIYQLSQNDIQFKITKEGKICMHSELWEGEKFIELMIQVGEYYRGVVEIVRTDEKLRKVSEWVKAEGISHRMSTSPNGTLVYIYSTSPKEAVINRKKLDSVLHGS